MSWIKIESHLRTKPEVIDIADKLGIKDTHAQGVCLAFWQWMDGITISGTAKVRRSMIDRVVNEPGFAAAMEQVGWLVIDDNTGTITMPNWDRHSGETAKDRALNGRRQKRHRDKLNNADVTEDSDNSNGTVTQERYATVTTVTHGPLPDKTRGEEMKKEETISSPTTSGGGEDVLSSPVQMAPPITVAKSTMPLGVTCMYPPPTPEQVAAASAWQGAVNPNATPKPIVIPPPGNPHIVTINPSTGMVLVSTETFRRFIDKFPKRSSMSDAAERWNHAITEGADPEHIIAGIAADPGLRKPPEEQKFLPQAAKWLDSRGWTCIPKPKPPEPPKPVPPPPTPEQIAEREKADAEHERRGARQRAKISRMSAIFSQNGMEPPTPAQLAQIDADLDKEFPA